MELRFNREEVLQILVNYANRAVEGYGFTTAEVDGYYSSFTTVTIKREEPTVPEVTNEAL